MMVGHDVRIWWLSWSADGRRVYFSLYRKVGDVYLLEGY